MIAEQQFFIQILKDHLEGSETKQCPDIEWKKVLFFAQIHQVEGIVFYQCKRFIPSEMYSFLEKKFSAELFYKLNRERSYKDIGDAFDREGIVSFVVKGFNVASCYPIPSLRTMGDLDIVVHREDKEKAGQVLETLGYKPKIVQAPDYDWSYEHNGIHLELHHLLFYDEPGINYKQADFFNRCWYYEDNGKLDWNFHFLFILAHLRKHLVNSGVGFRMFMDVAAIIKNDPGLNWRWIEEKLEQLEMKKFSKICFALCYRWFGVKAPLQYEELSDSFFEEATVRIFSNGVFGFNNEQNRNNETINRILTHGKARKLSRFQIAIRYLFPKYIHMRYIPYYSFIEGRPWLLPVAWVYRVIRLITGKVDSLSTFINRVSFPDSAVDDREEELRRWGLID